MNSFLAQGSNGSVHPPPILFTPSPSSSPLSLSLSPSLPLDVAVPIHDMVDYIFYFIILSLFSKVSLADLDAASYFLDMVTRVPDLKLNEPKLVAHLERMKAIPELADWLKKRPESPF